MIFSSLIISLLFFVTSSTKTKDEYSANICRNRPTNYDDEKKSNCSEGLYEQPRTNNKYTVFVDTFSTQRDVRKYVEFWFRLVNKDHLALSIKACKDGHILLTDSRNTSTGAFEIVLGADKNDRFDIRKAWTVTAIKNRSHNKTSQNFTKDNILNCNESLPFWIEWTDKAVVVKNGTTDSNILIQLNDSNVHRDFKVASVTGYTDGPKEYTLCEHEISSLRMSIKGNGQYKSLERTLVGVREIQFKVNSTNYDVSPAKIALRTASDGDFTNATYQIIIKSNSIDLIERLPSTQNNRNTTHSVAYIPRIGHWQTFWLRWDLGRISIRNEAAVFKVNTLVEDVISMAVDSKNGKSIEWEFGQSFDDEMVRKPAACSFECPPGLFPNASTGRCQLCSSLPNCHSCVILRPSQPPFCTVCKTGTLWMSDSGRCLTECPPHQGYTAVDSECTCTGLCGTAYFYLCVVFLPIAFIACIILLVLFIVRHLYQTRKKCDFTETEKEFDDDDIPVLPLPEDIVPNNPYTSEPTINQYSFEPCSPGALSPSQPIPVMDNEPSPVMKKKKPVPVKKNKPIPAKTDESIAVEESKPKKSKPIPVKDRPLPHRPESNFPESNHCDYVNLQTLQKNKK